jgi:hypothetical protein
LAARPAGEEVAEPVERRLADAQLVAAIGADSVWLALAIGQLFKTDRLDAARRTVAIALAEAGGVARRPASPRRRPGAHGSRCGRATPPGRGRRSGGPRGSVRDDLAAAGLVVLPDRRAGRARGLDEAQAVLAACGGEDADVGPRRRAAPLHQVEPAGGAGRRAGALAAQLEARRLQGGGSVPDPDFDGWLRIARLLHARGDAPAAAREAEAALAWARVWGTPGYLGQALAVSGLIRQGDEGIALLREAVAELDRSPARRELARALTALGAALRRRGERQAAREPLRRALDLASSGGLVATAERARRSCG